MANTRPRVSEEATLDSTRHLPAPSRILGRLWSALWPEAPLNQRSQPEKNKSSHYSRVPGNMDREMMKKKKKKEEEEEEERKGWEGKGEEPALSICLVADEITFCNSTVRRRILIPLISLGRLGYQDLLDPAFLLLLFILSLSSSLFFLLSPAGEENSRVREREREYVERGKEFSTLENNRSENSVEISFLAPSNHERFVNHARWQTTLIVEVFFLFYLLLPHII